MLSSTTPNGAYKDIKDIPSGLQTSGARCACRGRLRGRSSRVWGQGLHQVLLAGTTIRLVAFPSA